MYVRQKKNKQKNLIKYFFDTKSIRNISPNVLKNNYANIYMYRHLVESLSAILEFHQMEADIINETVL